MTDVLLRQEIEKLGGNEEDFKLVKDIEDPEDEEWKGPPPSTTDQSDDFNLEEFKKFHTSLNFDSVPKVISKAKDSADREDVKEEQKINLSLIFGYTYNWTTRIYLHEFCRG